MIRKTLTAALVALFAVLANPAPAQARHVGPYVANYVAGTIDVLVRGDDGLRFWQYVAEGHNSSRGANGVFVPSNNKIYYESIATGARYWSYCPQEYRRLGYVWTNKAYMPVPPDRSIKILDVDWRSECYGW